MMGSLLLSGCAAQMKEREQANKDYVNKMVSDCPNYAVDNPLNTPNAKNFSSLMESSLFSIDLAKTSVNSKFRHILMYSNTDYGRDGLKKLSDCYVSTIVPIKKQVKDGFEKTKAATSNQAEKTALIDAYSSWQTLVDTKQAVNFQAKQNYTQALNKYRNIAQ